MVTKRHVITAMITDKRGRVLSMGQNSFVKTHPLQAHHAARVGLPLKQFIHAEIHAIIRCPDLGRAHTIHVYRYDAAGRPALAKPCPVCQSAILAAGIPHIRHT